MVTPESPSCLQTRPGSLGQCSQGGAGSGRVLQDALGPGPTAWSIYTQQASPLEC
jgi:hypothetical protein